MKSSVSMMLALVAAAGCAHSAPPTGEQAARHVEHDPNWWTSIEDEDKTPIRECTSATTTAAPAEGRLTDFALVGQGSGQTYHIVSYPVDSAAAPAVTAKDGAIHIAANVPITTKAQYVGAALSFPTCMDASAFTGVRFSLRGTYSGCTMEYATIDVQHEDRHTKAPFATGKLGAYAPQTRLERAQVTQVAQTVTMPFTEHGIPGNPPLPLDKSKLIGLAWQLSVPLASNVDDGTTTCVAALDIDNITFYR